MNINFLTKKSVRIVKLGILILFIITACSNNSNSNGSRPTPTQDSNISLIPTQTSIPPTELSIVSVVPEIQHHCPTEREIPFSQLEVKNNERLLLTTDDFDVWILNPNSDEPVKFPFLDDPSIKISPDHLWVADLMLIDQDDDGPEVYSVRILSFEGTELPQEIRYTDNTTPYLEWLTPNSIELWKPSGDINRCPIRKVGFNPHTLEAYQIPDTLNDVSLECSTGPYNKYIHTNPLQVIDYDGSQWILSNLSNQETHAILPWLKETSSFYRRFGLNWGENGLAVVIPREEGFDMAYGQDVFSSSKDNPLFHVNVQGELTQSVLWWSRDGSQIGFDIAKEPWKNKNVLHPEFESKFQVYDAENNILYDYCLDRDLGLGGPNGGIDSKSLISLDEKFLVWTIYDPEANFYILGSVILDLETGYYSWLENYSVVGWGLIP